jgi:hypothetical protein
MADRVFRSDRYRVGGCGFDTDGSDTLRPAKAVMQSFGERAFSAT